MIYLGIIAIALLLWHVVSELLNRKERKDLLNRIMSRDYKEYQYYDKAYEGDLDIFKRNQEDSVAGEIPPEKPDFTEKDAKEFIENLETDWRTEEIDSEKLEVTHEPSHD